VNAVLILFNPVGFEIEVLEAGAQQLFVTDGMQPQGFDGVVNRTRRVGELLAVRSFILQLF